MYGIHEGKRDDFVDRRGWDNGRTDWYKRRRDIV